MHAAALVVSFLLADPTPLSAPIVEPPRDPATLLSLMQACRADLDHVDVTAVSERWDSELIRPHPRQSWRTAWTPAAFRVDISTLSADSGAPIDDLLERSFDGATAVFYDGFASAQVSGSPQGLGLPGIVPDYLGLLGVFPMRSVSGETTFENDPLRLLTLPGVVVLPQSTTIGGVECIGVELWNNEAPVPYRKIDAFYAPGAGYAQKLLRVFRSDGSQSAQWETHEWLDRGPDQVALPLKGESRRYNAFGDLAGTISISVAPLADGSPAISLGAPIDFAVAVPAGTSIVDVDSGKTWIAQASGPVDPESGLATAGGPPGEAAGDAILAGTVRPALLPVLAVAFGCLACAAAMWMAMPMVRRARGA